MEISKFDLAVDLQNKIANTKRKIEILMTPKSQLSVCHVSQKSPMFSIYEQDYYRDWDLSVDDRQCLLSHYEMILMNYEKEFEAL